MTKKQKILLVAAGVILLLTCSFWQINKIDEYSSRYFLDHTMINGVDCSGMTTAEAKETLTKHWNDHDFVIEREGKVMGRIENLDLTYDIDQKLQEVLERPLYKRVFYYLTKKNVKISIAMTVREESKGFQKQTAAMNFLNRKYTVKTKDAYVDLSNRKFEIVKEVQGDNIDRDRFKKAVLQSIAEGKFTLEYKAEVYYQQPKIYSVDQKLREYREYCRENFSQTITYRFYNKGYTLTPADLQSMITVEDEKRQVNEKAVEKFVSHLAITYDTLGTARKFRSTYKGNISVTGGSYGYAIDHKKEFLALVKDLKSEKDVSRKPKYSQIPYYTGGGLNDIGSDYVEIDIANQHLWLYQKGHVVIESPIVTGSLAGGYATPKGVYYLVYKAEGVSLRGRNSDGSTYNSPVKYWMPFYQDYGMHDASWRGDFGGDIYRTSGSHGCVNMPSSSAAILYARITAGYPVVVH